MSTVTVVKSLTVAGRTFVGSELDDLKVLVCQTANHGTFREMGDTSGYQVPTGKKLQVWAVVGVPRTGSDTNASCMVKMGYGDNDVGQGSASAPTNVVYAFGGDTDGCLQSTANNNSIGGASNWGLTTNHGWGASILFEVPANKYPSLQTDVNGSGICWGLELTV